MKPLMFPLVAALLGPLVIAETEGLPWICHGIDNSMNGADGVKLTREENEGEGSRGMGVIWYRNPIGKAQP